MTEKQFKKYHLVVPGSHHLAMRLDKYIASSIQNTSRNKVQKAIKNGYIKVNDSVEKKSYNIQPGDTIDIHLPISAPPETKPEKMNLDIIHEDDDLLIVNKSGDRVVHPAPGNWSGTLVNGLMWHAESLSKEDEETVRPGIVHRLDKDTSGLLVVAKNNETHRTLNEYFRDHNIERKYRAIIWGRPDKKEGTITGNIGRNPNDRKKMAVRKDGNGKKAVTHYKVLEYFDYLSFIEVKLETGRTHQIRVHFANEHHWLFGDRKYGGDSVRYGSNTGSRKNMFKNLFSRMKRQCLHAQILGFVHPGTGQFVEFNAEPPPDFKHVLKMLRKNCT